MKKVVKKLWSKRDQLTPTGWEVLLYSALVHYVITPGVFLGLIIGILDFGPDYIWINFAALATSFILTIVYYKLYNAIYFVIDEAEDEDEL